MRIQGFYDQKLKADKKFLIKNYNLPIPRLPLGTSKLQKKFSALNREHPAVQDMKFLKFFYFCGSFLLCWIWIRIPNTDLDPDAMAWLNPDPIRIRIQSGSNPNPDPIRIQFEAGSETLDKAREELRQLDQKHAALTTKLKAEADAHR
jgi:hypothetical protein